MNKKELLENKLRFLEGLLKDSVYGNVRLRFLNYNRIQAEGEVRRIRTLLEKYNTL